MANPARNVDRARQREAERAQRQERSRLQASVSAAAAGALEPGNVPDAAIPAGWKAPRGTDAFAYARDFALKHPDVARIRVLPVPGSKLTVVHIRGQHLAESALKNVPEIRATQEEMYRIALALVERGDVAAGHVENWTAADVRTARGETARSYYRDRHKARFQDPAGRHVGDLPKALRKELDRGPQVGDAVYGTLAKLYFEGKIALLPSSLEALENSLAQEFAQTAKTDARPESVEGAVAALAPTGTVTRRSEEREDTCLRQALRPDFAPLGNVRLVCDGATHDYVDNCRKMGVSVVEITPKSVHRAVGTAPDPAPFRAPMSRLRMALTAAGVLAALTAAGGAAYALKKQDAEAAAAMEKAFEAAREARAADLAPTPPRVAASIPEGWKGPLVVADPARYVRDFSLSLPGVTGKPIVLAAPEGAKCAIVIIPQLHGDVLTGLPGSLAGLDKTVAAQKDVAKVLESLAAAGVAAVHVEGCTPSNVTDEKILGKRAFYRAYFDERVRGTPQDAVRMDQRRAAAVKAAKTAYRALSEIGTPKPGRISSIQAMNEQSMALASAQSPLFEAYRLPENASPAQVSAAYAALRKNLYALEESALIARRYLGEGEAYDLISSVFQTAKGDAARDSLLAAEGSDERFEWYFGAADRLFFQGKIALLPGITERGDALAKSSRDLQNDGPTLYAMRQWEALEAVDASSQFGVSALLYGGGHYWQPSLDKWNSDPANAQRKFAAVFVPIPSCMTGQLTYVEQSPVNPPQK